MVIKRFKKGTVPAGYTLFKSGTLYDYAVPTYQVELLIEEAKKAQPGERVGFLTGVRACNQDVYRFVNSRFKGVEILTYASKVTEIKRVS